MCRTAAAACVILALASGCARQEVVQATSAEKTAASVVPSSPLAETAPAPDLEYIGTDGQSVLLLDHSTGLRQWIRIGGQSGSIQVLSVDAASGDALILVGAQRQTLQLRSAGAVRASQPAYSIAPSPETGSMQPSVLSNAMMSAGTMAPDGSTTVLFSPPPPVSPASPGESGSSSTGELNRPNSQGVASAGVPEGGVSSLGPVSAEAPAPLTPIEIEEREARMLVSDLLELSQIHRKAYEQKKAAEDAAARGEAPAMP